MNFNIFNTDFNNQSVPQKSWLYRVLFFSEDESNAEIMTNANTKIIVLKATLPKVETKIVTQNFMNTKKSFPIARDYSGTTTLEFQLKSESSENEYIKAFAAFIISSLFLSSELSYMPITLNPASLAHFTA